jgi:hypothetical protein
VNSVICSATFSATVKELITGFQGRSCFSALVCLNQIKLNTIFGQFEKHGTEIFSEIQNYDNTYRDWGYPYF